MMKLRAWFLMLTVVVGAGVVVSGSSVLRGSPEHVSIDASQSELTAAVRGVDERLARLEVETVLVDRTQWTPPSASSASRSSSASSMSNSAATASDSTTRASAAAADVATDDGAIDDVDRVAEPGVLRARSARIRECIDSLDRAGDDAWRGALPGLRAAVADLEYRTDLAELAAIDSSAALNAHIEIWLQEMAQQIANMAEDGEKAAYDRGLLDDARVAHARLVERFTALREDGADTDGALRRSLAEELTELRRTVRALLRAARQRPADRTA